MSASYKLTLALASGLFLAAAGYHVIGRTGDGDEPPARVTPAREKRAIDDASPPEHRSPKPTEPDDDPSGSSRPGGRGPETPTLTLGESPPPIWNRSDPGASPSRDRDAARGRNTAAGEKQRTYTVRKGDTLSSIALTLYGTRRHWIDILRVNPGLDPRSLAPGQTLGLPRAEAVSAGNGAWADNSPVLEHEVEKGETLTGIARRVYGTTALWELIYRANRSRIGEEPNALAPGMRLKIPPPHRWEGDS